MNRAKLLNYGVIFTVIAIMLIDGLRLLSHPATDFDEGVYLTTFQLVHAGYPLYTSVFHSQLPGFFLLIYPFFQLFGQTLEAARLGIFFYSLIGIIAIIWIGRELKNLGITFCAIALLYLSPIFTTQTITFHADILPLTWSLVALASLLRLQNTGKNIWVYIGAACLGVSLVTKFDLALLPAFYYFVIIANGEKKCWLLVKRLVAASALIITPLLLTLLIFHPDAVWKDVVGLRLAASKLTYPPLQLLQLLTHEMILMGIVLLALLLTILSFHQKHTASQKNVRTALIFWLITTIVLLCFYRPLFPHHLVALLPPAALLFSYSSYLMVSKKTSVLLHLGTIIFLLISLIFYTHYVFTSVKKISTTQQDQIVTIIKNTTRSKDYVVCDDSIVTALSMRLPPPVLSDVSQVRINSGHLSSQEFELAVQKYRPKLILPLTDRLVNIKNFAEIMKKNGYRPIYVQSLKKPVYFFKTPLTHQ